MNELFTGVITAFRLSGTAQRKSSIQTLFPCLSSRLFRARLKHVAGIFLETVNLTAMFVFDLEEPFPSSRRKIHDKEQ
jgi:hypothetical protein